MLDVQSIRKDFPILDHKIYDKPLIYFDNGATTQKPRCVVEKIESGYYNVNANIHRGVHFLSQAATEAHEDARKTVQQFLNARSSNEIIFTRGTTEAINLIASSFTDECMSAGDEVIVSVMEHHSNIVPWQIQAARKGIPENRPDQGRQGHAGGAAGLCASGTPQARGGRPRRTGPD